MIVPYNETKKRSPSYEQVFLINKSINTHFLTLQGYVLFLLFPAQSIDITGTHLKRLNETVLINTSV